MAILSVHIKLSFDKHLKTIGKKENKKNTERPAWYCIRHISINLWRFLSERQTKFL